jgi:hypothetical protein
MQLLRGCWARPKHGCVLLRRLFDNLPNWIRRYVKASVPAVVP